MFVDLPGTRPAPALVDQTLRFEGDADIVRQVRVGRHPNNTTRVVLDAAGVTSYSVYPLYSPYRLVIDCVRVPAAVAAAGDDRQGAGARAARRHATGEPEQRGRRGRHRAAGDARPARQRADSRSAAAARAHDDQSLAAQAARHGSASHDAARGRPPKRRRCDDGGGPSPSGRRRHEACCQPCPAARAARAPEVRDGRRTDRRDRTAVVRHRRHDGLGAPSAATARRRRRRRRTTRPAACRSRVSWGSASRGS